MGDLLETIKKAALQAMQNSDPTALILGEVISADPLEIKIEQRLTLDRDNLILTRNVTDYTINLEFDLTSSDSLDEHNHTIEGVYECVIKNALVVGELVLLIRQQGGQKFIVVDRVVKS